MEYEDQKNKAIIRAASFFLGRPINNLSELSDNQLVFLSSFSPSEINRCFAVQEVLAGCSYQRASIKYGISGSRLHEIVTS